MKTQINERLVAVMSQRQVDALIKLELIDSTIDKQVVGPIRRLAELIASDQTFSAKLLGYSDIMQLMLAEMTLAVEVQLQEFARWSHRTAAEAIVKAVPRKWLLTRVPLAARFKLESTKPARSGYLIMRAGELRLVYEDNETALPFGAPVEPLAKPVLLDTDKEEVMKRILFPPPSQREVAEMVGRTGWADRFANLSKLITDKRALFGQLVTGYSDGENLKQLTKRVLPLVDDISASAKRIARTEGMRIAEQMQRKSWAPLGDMLEGAQIIAVLDERTRPEHATRNGTIYYANPKGNQKGMQELPDLPDAPNCILPKHSIGGIISGALKAWYAGEVIQITMATGRSITVTANHPILTEHGFVAASTIQKGDYLLSDRKKVHGPSVVANHVQQRPVVIEDVFDSIAVDGVRTKPVIVDFHGDELEMKGQVEVVGYQRVLLNREVSKAIEFIDKDLFSDSNVQFSPESGAGSECLSAGGVAVAAPSRPCLRKLSLDQLPIGLQSTPLHSLSIGLTAKLHTLLLQMVSESYPSDATVFRYLVQRFPRMVLRDKVLDVSYRHYSGHVYDLQSEVGWYSCNGIIVHNCRCMSVPILEPPKELDNDPVLKAQFQNAQGVGIPDPAAYSEWFKQADPRRRMLVVGVKRYREMEKRLAGQREPEWTDFVNSDGKLLAVTTLRDEDIPTRTARKQLVQSIIDTRERLIKQNAEKGFIWSGAQTTFPSRKSGVANPVTTAQQRTIRESRKLIDKAKYPKPLFAGVEPTQLGSFAERKARLMSAWTVNSTNQTTALELKEAAIREFRLRGSAFATVQAKISQENLQLTQADLRRVYQATQEEFRKRNVKHVTLYRGRDLSKIEEEAAVASWTSSKRTAEDYAGPAGIVEERVYSVEEILVGQESPGWKDGPRGNQAEYLVMY